MNTKNNFCSKVFLLFTYKAFFLKWIIKLSCLIFSSFSLYFRIFYVNIWPYFYLRYSYKSDTEILNTFTSRKVHYKWNWNWEWNFRDGIGTEWNGSETSIWWNGMRKIEWDRRGLGNNWMGWNGQITPN